MYVYIHVIEKCVYILSEYMCVCVYIYIYIYMFELLDGWWVYMELCIHNLTTFIEKSIVKNLMKYQLHTWNTSISSIFSNLTT